MKIYFIPKLAKLQASDSSYNNACIIVVFNVSDVNLYKQQQFNMVLETCLRCIY